MWDVRLNFVWQFKSCPTSKKVKMFDSDYVWHEAAIVEQNIIRTKSMAQIMCD